MTGNANSVNIKNAKRGYHHGDLRATLIDEGLKLLKARTADELSLREVARNAGVSATAVYRHFPDKNALIKALCGEGDRLLAGDQGKAQEAAGGGKAGFDASGRAYVRFALAHPALFRLMMANLPELHPETDGSGGSVSLNLLLNSISSLFPETDGLDDGQRKIIALQSWAVVHGLAMLMLDGQVPQEHALIDQIICTPGAR